MLVAKSISFGPFAVVECFNGFMKTLIRLSTIATLFDIFGMDTES